VLQRFYNAFTQRDWARMGACYRGDARFSDPVFPMLHATEVRAMWKMLLAGNTDLRISFRVLKSDARNGQVRWEAWYTFSKTKRLVHNVITSTFVVQDDLIVEQRDDFDFWRWSGQALGPVGALFGWSPWLRAKVRNQATERLRKSMVSA
jgi:limonene-1,2-epoxide hydrolase